MISLISSFEEFCETFLIIADLKASMLSFGTKCVATPYVIASYPLTRWPVNAMKRPNESLFLSLGIVYVAPASVKKPIPVSGIDQRVLSVAILKGAC